MRLSRSSLLGRLADPSEQGIVLLEAPSGYGKSWLMRRAFGRDVPRLRGELGSLGRASAGDVTDVIIDDAHLLSSVEVDRLAALLEHAPSDVRILIAGRLVPDTLHEVAHLIDATVIDAAQMAIAPDEIVEFVPDRSDTVAERVIEAADGCVRTVMAALEQYRTSPEGDPVALASRLARSMGMAALQRLDVGDRAVVGLLARSPGVDQYLVEQFAGRGFVERALAAGVPLRRPFTGGLELAAVAVFRQTPVEPTAAIRLANDLAGRDRPIDAIELLLDAGVAEQAARTIMGLSESVTDTVDPRRMMGFLGRLGSVVDREPALLLVRAAAKRYLGRVDEANVDINHALTLVDNAEPKVRRRVEAEAARALVHDGQHDEARRAANAALADLGPGEERTYARAHVVLAECSAVSANRADLQRSAEYYRIAAAAWDGCGESARARACRRDLAMVILVQLGRYDEALALVNQVLKSSDLSDAERVWTIAGEGFVLVNAARLDAAAARFKRVSDIGLVQDNPRLIAIAAWGQALVSAARNDLEETLRWLTTAENTALTTADDVLGVPFLCDMANSLGALGEMRLARRYLDAAIDRRSIFPDRVRQAGFILDARSGKLGDVAAQLERTPPAEWWRVELVSAHAAARNGDPRRAAELAASAKRELHALGFGNAGLLGEAREENALRAVLAAAPEPAAEPVLASEVPASKPSAGAAPVPDGRRLLVFRSPMVFRRDGRAIEIPPGNPQRLIGAVVAHGGSATFDQVSEAIWSGEDAERSRARLRNVLLRLRKASGDIVTRTGSGIRLSDDVVCDLLDFQRMASDALSSARADPDVAGRLATDAVELVTGTAFADFEYDEWALLVRRDVDNRMLALLDLLSVQAEDNGDLPLAQAYAERALRLDRYTDSRYIRLAELLTLQDRTAAAIAVLDDAAEAARELGTDPAAGEATHQRESLIRRTAARQ